MKKFLAMLSAALLVASLCIVSAFAQTTYTDVGGHWARKAIERWSEYNIVSGYGDQFKPNAPLTRGQMAKVLSNTLGLKDEPKINPFSDVEKSDWYSSYILRCYAADIMKGDGDLANPTSTITRQQAITMLCRAFNIDSAGTSNLSKYSDRGEVGAYAAPYVSALINRGVVSGVSKDRIGPNQNLTRAAFMTILDRMVVQYINKSGTYTLNNGDGLILITAGGVTLSGRTNADILISPAVDNRTVTFKNATVSGSITVLADKATINKDNSTLPTPKMLGTGSSVKTVTPTKIDPKKNATTSDLGITSSQTVSSGTYRNVTITSDVENGTVTLSNVKITGTLTIEGGGSNSIKLKNCTVSGTVYMDKSGGQIPRLELTNTPISRIEIERPAIVEATDARSRISNMSALEDVTIRGKNTQITSLTIPASISRTVDIDVFNGTVEQLLAKSATNVVGTDGTVTKLTVQVPISIASEIARKVEVSSAASNNMTISISGSQSVDVIVNSAKGVAITADHADKVNVSTGLSTPPSNITLNQAKVHIHKWDNGTVTKAATCTEVGTKTFRCSGCSETKMEEIAKTAHKSVVDKAVAATCTESGLTEGSHCSVCNAVIKAQSAVPALGHDFSKSYQSDADMHWHICSRCKVLSEKAAHKFDNTTDCSKPATCTECGHIKAAGNHVWNEGIISKQASCAEDGETIYTCTICGDVMREKIPAIGHDFSSEYTVDLPATCVKSGIKSYHCTRDGCLESSGAVEIPAIGHKEVADDSIEATCTEPGSTGGSHCSACGAQIKEAETVPAKGHSPVTDTEKPATCTESGLTEGSHCSVCGVTITAQEPIPASGHQYGNWSDFGDGAVHIRTCTVCKATDSASHNWDESNTCTVCGSKKPEEVDPGIV